MGLPPVRSAVLLIAQRNIWDASATPSGIKREWYVCINVNTGMQTYIATCCWRTVWYAVQYTYTIYPACAVLGQTQPTKNIVHFGAPSLYLDIDATSSSQRYFCRKFTKSCAFARIMDEMSAPVNAWCIRCSVPNLKKQHLCTHSQLFVNAGNGPSSRMNVTVKKYFISSIPIGCVRVCTVNSTSDHTHWTLYRSYFKGISANIELPV
jgi:hypothetical protein